MEFTLDGRPVTFSRQSLWGSWFHVLMCGGALAAVSVLLALVGKRDLQGILGLVMFAVGGALLIVWAFSLRDLKAQLERAEDAFYDPLEAEEDLRDRPDPAGKA